jgi:hypothetical protein
MAVPTKRHSSVYATHCLARIACHCTRDAKSDEKVEAAIACLPFEYPKPRRDCFHSARRRLLSPVGSTLIPAWRSRINKRRCSHVIVMFELLCWGRAFQAPSRSRPAEVQALAVPLLSLFGPRAGFVTLRQTFVRCRHGGSNRPSGKFKLRHELGKRRLLAALGATLAQLKRRKHHAGVMKPCERARTLPRRTGIAGT